MKARAVRAFAAGLAAAASIASAQQPAPPPPPSFAAPNLSEKGVQSLAASCAMCHGTNGRPAPGSTVPGLAGRAQQDLIDRVNAFKQGKAEATIMHQIAKGFGEAEIAALAGYFARQPQ